MVQVMKVKCPRCGRVWTAYDGTPDVTCTCHLFCEDGSKPSDCTLVDHTAATNDAWGGNWNFPQGLHLGRSKTDDDTQARLKWCTTHSHFVAKVPFLIKCDWSRWYGRRAPKDLRFTRDV